MEPSRSRRLIHRCQAVALLRPRWFASACILAALLGGCSREAPPGTGLEPLPLTVASLEELPARWRPPESANNLHRDTPWSAVEEAIAGLAYRHGLDEMAAWFAEYPESIAEVGADAVECILDQAHASTDPRLREQALDDAHSVFGSLAAPSLERPLDSIEADDFPDLLALAIYGHRLDPGSERAAQIVERANLASAACKNLTQAMEIDYRAVLADPDATRSQAYELLLWCVALTDAQRVPGLQLPEGAADVLPAVWPFLAAYPLPDADTFADGACNEIFYDLAYLATHIGYVPSGYGRHPLCIEDAPGLYRFLRRNFYAVLEMGELDLVAEFVDLLRQYGGTPENDVQVRDGTRHLLKLFHAAGESWMAHREPDATRGSSNYDLIHKPWTGIAGVRPRKPEPCTPGTYGYIFRQAFPLPCSELQ